MAKKRPKQSPGAIGKVTGPWEPSEKHLRWYRMWTCDLMSQVEIGAKETPSVGRVAVCQAVHRVGEYIRQQEYEKIMTHRDRQTAIHENIASKAYAEFEKEQSTKNCQYLKTAMDALAAIRKIWGVDAPVKSQITMHHEEIQGLPGMQGFGSRSEFLKAHAKAVEELAAQSEASERSAVLHKDVIECD